MKTDSEQQYHRDPQGHKSNVKLNMQRDGTPRDDAPALPILWDSLESDTESLVQEKAYQRELQMRIAHDSGLLSAQNSKHKSDRRDVEYREEEHYNGLHDFRQANGPKTTDGHGPLR